MPSRSGRLVAIAVALLLWPADGNAEGSRTGFRGELRQAVDTAARDLAATNPPGPPAPAATPGKLVPHAPPSRPPSRPPSQLQAQPAAVVSATPPIAPSMGPLDDPLETINRVIMAVNLAAMRYVLTPTVDLYHEWVPAGGRQAIGNAFRNLREPVNLTSAVMQGEWNDAQIIFTRFIINSTIGLGGILDQANVLGLTARVRPVDQALCRWGIGAGPYVVLPLLGPSSARDSGARLAVLTAQTLVLGIFVIPYRVADIFVQYAATRDTWEALDIDGPDGYERLRSVYQLYAELPCTARNAADNGLFFQ